MNNLEFTTAIIRSCLIFFILSLISSRNAVAAGDSPAEKNPFTPKAYLIRYWKKQISNDLPKPWFLLNKASPLSAAQMATFSKLANQNALSAQFPSFCSSAKLLCFPDLSPSLESHRQDVKFSSYLDKNFTNYGSGRAGGFDSFKNYSDGENLPVNSFRRYSHDSSGHDDKFANYAPQTNVADQSFTSYGSSTAGGSGSFNRYNQDINVPNLRFTSYSDQATGRIQSFKGYTDNANAGNEAFRSYGKNGNGAANDFTGYGNNSNVIGSDFNNYGETGNGANDTFTSYGSNGNVPENNFQSYGDAGNGGVDKFSNYRDQSNVGDDTFKSYAKSSNVNEVDFSNYGQSFNEGSDTFAGYGKGANDPKVAFTTYGVNNTFKEYAKEGATFKGYMNETTKNQLASAQRSNGKVQNRWVEPGKFFKEKMLKIGAIMPMPNIVDKMPERSFLPRSIASKLPFSISKLIELKKIFHAGDNSTMESMIVDSLKECERAPSAGETKRCVGSAEDMIDFATATLGRNVVVRTTENTNGSGGEIMIGEVKGINGGEITKSVSCHQSMYPYLLYYCHSVPKVRVYEADILNPKTEAKINRGVAICHVDTSAWGATHGAFVALSSSPGKTEVCHWIFQNDMTWTVAD